MRKIIIQERDNDIANVLRILLSQAGYHVMTIKSPDSLMAFISQFKPDVILLEYFNGESEAVNTLAYLKNELRIKVIATSCNANRSYVVNTLGFDECLEKPFDNEELVRIVRSVL